MFIDQNQFLSTFFYNRRILITSVFHFVATVEEREKIWPKALGRFPSWPSRLKPVELTKRKWNETVRSKYEFQLDRGVPFPFPTKIFTTSQRIRVETSIFRKERWLFRSDRTDWWKRRTLKVDLFPENFLLPFILRPKSTEILAYWKANLASVVCKQISRCYIWYMNRPVKIGRTGYSVFLRRNTLSPMTS